jgi:hypothetical protein
MFLKGRHAQMLLAARRGNVEAQMELATCYSEGDGVEQNYAEAAHWFGEAAKLGTPADNSAWGFVTPMGRGGAGLRGSRAVVSQGGRAKKPGAQVSLGLCLQKGLGVYPSPQEAVHWFRQAAESGDAAGQMSLASCLQSGEGVAKNEAEALEWFRKAAAGGWRRRSSTWASASRTAWAPLSMKRKPSNGSSRRRRRACRRRNLKRVFAYWHGRGTAVDLPEAFAWLSLAARRAIPNARETCEELKAEMTPEQIEDGSPPRASTASPRSGGGAAARWPPEVGVGSEGSLRLSD